MNCRFYATENKCGIRNLRRTVNLMAKDMICDSLYDSIFWVRLTSNLSSEQLLCVTHTVNFRYFRSIIVIHLFSSLCPSVHPYACKNSRMAERIFIKCGMKVMIIRNYVSPSDGVIVCYRIVIWEWLHGFSWNFARTLCYCRLLQNDTFNFTVGLNR